MKNLPKYILVVSYMNSKKYKSSFKIFTDYLKEIPHIKYECYGKHKDTILYVIPKTVTYRHIIQELEDKLLPSNIGHATYEYVNKPTIPYKMYPFSSTFNAIFMPISIEIPIKYKERLIEINYKD